VTWESATPSIPPKKPQIEVANLSTRDVCWGGKLHINLDNAGASTTLQYLDIYLSSPPQPSPTLDASAGITLDTVDRESIIISLIHEISNSTNSLNALSRSSLIGAGVEVA